MQSSGPPIPAPIVAPILAIDIGGTKMAVGLVDEAGRVLWSARQPTPPMGRAEELWAVLKELVDAALGQARPVVVGVGCGGPMEPGGTSVSPLNIPGWWAFPLKSALEEATGLTVWVDNDAKALALAEGWVGAAATAGTGNYLSMVVSTGVGGGIVLNGRLLEGRTGNAGHIGHVVVNPGGRLCGCGASGCLEAEASGLAIAAMTGRPPAEADPQTIDRAGTMVGRAVASVVNLLDLDLVTVAGSVALGFGEPFFAAAAAELAAAARLGYSARCRIVASPLGADGPLIGAAAVGRRGNP